MKFRFIVVLLLGGLGCASTCAQVVYLQWKGNLPQDFILKDSLDSEDVTTYLSGLIRDLQDLSHLEASIDSIWVEGQKYHIQIHTGPSYRWSYLDFSQVPDLLRDELPNRPVEGLLFSLAEIRELFERLLVKAENHGYPLAAVRLEKVSADTGSVEAIVKVQLNQRFAIETIRNQGNLRLQDRYFQHILEMRPGEVFNRQKIAGMEERLSLLPFIKIVENPRVELLENAATLWLHLDKKNANRFDILLGLLPASGGNRRFILTGNVNIDLANSLGAGEVFHLKYESLMPGTQNLDLSLNYPFLFNWSFGTDLKFELYKRDSTYIDIIYRMGVQLFLKRQNYIQFFGDHQISNLITVDTLRIKQQRSLPSFLDLRQRLWGMAIHLEKLNYRLNPRKGYDITMRAAVGTKKIRKNNTILNLKDESDPEFDFGQLYDDLKLNSFQYRIFSGAQYFIPLFKNSTLRLAHSAGLIGSGQKLFLNELFRIGGSRLMRGFNEQAIFASFYSVQTIEYRLLFNRNSNLFIFMDLGYYDQNTLESRYSDRPLGLGTGLNLETGVGIFTISYAIGGDRQLPLSFRNGRIHFGMTSGF